MSGLDKLLTKWKMWINRDHTFQADELKELQSHLMEEINFLVNREGLSEEEAFHKAVSLVGEREGLDQEYVKVKSAPNKVIHWMKVNPWSVSATLLILALVSSYFILYRPITQENLNLRKDLGFIKTFKGTFKPLEGIDIFGQPLNNPVLAWKKEIVQSLGTNNCNIDMAITQNGDIYARVGDYYQRSEMVLNFISSDALKSWNKKNIENEYLPTKSGILINSYKKTNIFTNDSQNQLEFYKGKTGFIIGPNNMLYQFGKNMTLSSFDSSRKLRWIFQIPIKNININYGNVIGYFFDTKSNMYLIISYHDGSNVLYSISNDGELLTQREFPETLINFPPFALDFNGKFARMYGLYHMIGEVFEDKFFIQNIKTINEKNVGVIKALDFNLKELWNFQETDLGQFESDFVFSPYLDLYPILYLIYTKQKTNQMCLQAISSEGELSWEKELGAIRCTNPILDKEGNIYVGILKNANLGSDFNLFVICFTPDGSVKWIWEDKKLNNCSFNSDLVFGPNGSIYFAVVDKNDKLYCVKIASTNKK